MITKVDIVKICNFDNKHYLSFNINIDDILSKLQTSIVYCDLNTLEDMKDFKSLFLHVFFSDVISNKFLGNYIDSMEISNSFFEMIKYIFKNIEDLEANIHNLVSAYYDVVTYEIESIVNDITEYLPDGLESLAVHTEKIFFRDEELLTGIAIIKLEIDG